MPAIIVGTRGDRDPRRDLAHVVVLLARHLGQVRAVGIADEVAQRARACRQALHVGERRVQFGERGRRPHEVALARVSRSKRIVQRVDHQLQLADLPLQVEEAPDGADAGLAQHLALHLDRVLLEPVERRAVGVDHRADDRHQRRRHAAAQPLPICLQLLAGSTQRRRLAVADRDDEPLAGQHRDLAEVHHLLAVVVGRGAQHEPRDSELACRAPPAGEARARRRRRCRRDRTPHRRCAAPRDSASEGRATRTRPAG